MLCLLNYKKFTMEVISNEITTVTMSKNTIPFNVNFDSLLEKYEDHSRKLYNCDEDQENFKLFYKHNFSISLEDGTNFPAYIIIFHNNAGWGEPNQIGFTVVMEKEEMKNVNMKVDFQLTINEEIPAFESKVLGRTFTTATTNTSGNITQVYGIEHSFENIAHRNWSSNSPYIDQLKSVKGKMIFTFETKSLFTFHKEFIHSLGLNLVTPGGKEDFTIICQDQKIKFKKQLLINVSSVFREMLESQWTEESKNGQVEIEEVKPETLLAFKNLLVNGNDFKKEDLDIEMMIFADRYDIKALFNLCEKYIDSFSVNDENIFEFVQGLYLINNGSFINNAILLMRKNYGALEQDPRWKEFAKKHPDCVLKMLKHSMEN